jgi:hypothetical protein
MPDIAMCAATGCPLRNGCYRHRAVTFGRQDWLGGVPYDAATGRCEHLLDVRGYEAPEDRVRARAHALWQAAGRPEGQAEAHWHQARRALEADTLQPVEAEGAG